MAKHRLQSPPPDGFVWHFWFEGVLPGTGVAVPHSEWLAPDDTAPAATSCEAMFSRS